VGHRRKGSKVEAGIETGWELHEGEVQGGRSRGIRGAESPPSDSHVLLQGSHIHRAPLITISFKASCYFWSRFIIACAFSPKQSRCAALEAGSHIWARQVTRRAVFRLSCADLTAARKHLASAPPLPLKSSTIRPTNPVKVGIAFHSSFSRCECVCTAVRFEE
jgi:hypothetical protein